jgi:transposase-like protein
MSQHQPKTEPNRNGQLEVEVPDPEVVPRAKRRQFSAQYKLRILTEADQCTQRGEIGALLRREGLYSSHLTTWRKQRERGQLQGLTPKKRGRKPDPQAAELARLQRENERLKARLEQPKRSSRSKKNFLRCWAYRRPRRTRANETER